MNEKQEHNFLEGYDLTNTPDVMTSKEQEGLEREQPRIRLNDIGAPKAEQERQAAAKRALTDIPSPDEYQKKIGLTETARDDKHARELLSKLIETPKGEAEDQFQELLKNFKN